MATAAAAAKTVVMAVETLMAVMAVAAMPQLMTGVMVAATIAFRRRSMDAMDKVRLLLANGVRRLEGLF
jgi:hypothetical protein